MCLPVCNSAAGGANGKAQTVLPRGGKAKYPQGVAAVKEAQIHHPAALGTPDIGNYAGGYYFAAPGEYICNMHSSPLPPNQFNV